MSVEIDLTTERHGGGKRFLSGQVTQFTYAGKDGNFSDLPLIAVPVEWK
ncbi:Uncharacterised protein [Delftia tsuruhatensis]|nr:Uncharacterised protein [Delftia tsuruhatensis]